MSLPTSVESTVTKGRILQSVCPWCYKGMPLEQLAQTALRVGIKGIDLVGPEHWPLLKKYGLVGTMTPSHSITKGLNRLEHHAECLAAVRRSIELTADAGFPNVICFSGNRDGLTDEEGLQNCVRALKQVVGLAEQKNVTLCMELLNSKLDHRDYMCDRVGWAVQLAQMVGSERFKILFDIYHVQVQEGDIIASIRKYQDYIGHYHTAGVPGRHEIDETQELNYPAIMHAIADTGYKGYVAHEFIPQRDPVESLAKAAQLCDV